MFVGYKHTDSLILDLNTGKITQRTKMNSTISDGHSLTLCDGDVFVTGGYDRFTNKTLETVERYHGDQWHTMSSMNQARGFYHNTCSFRGTIYVFGGVNAHGLLYSIEKYDLKQDKWFTLRVELPESNRWLTHPIREDEFLLLD